MLEAPEPSQVSGAGGEEEEPGRAGGRPGGGGGGMAEPSGAETRPPIRVTVKTPKDKEEIVISDRASVKEVVQVGVGRGGGSTRRGWLWTVRRPGGPGSEGPGRGGGGPAGTRRAGEGAAGRGRPARVAGGSVARAGEGRPGFALWPGLGAWWRAGCGHLAQDGGSGAGERAPW